MPATDHEEEVLAELETLLLAIRAARDDSRQGDFVRHHDRSAASSQPAPHPDALASSASAAALDAVAFTPARLAESQTSHHRLCAAEGQDANAGERQGARPRRRLAAIAALLVVCALVLLWAFNRSQGSPERAAPTQEATQLRSADPPPVPPAAASPPVDPHGLRIDLTIIRRVWLRVTVDGRVAVEREVAAGEQLRFGADRSIVVRAGDAGAVMVRTDGGEQTALGRDGQVLTRALAAPAQ